MVYTKVGETDYLYWAHNLREFTDEDLKRGRGLAAKHTGSFLLGDFIAMCSPGESQAAHKLFLPKISVKASKETKAKYMAQLRAML